MLTAKAKEIRQRTLEMVLKAGAGHLGGSFSCAEILVTLYYGNILRYDAANPAWEERDRFILSKGHANNSLYVILADVGFFQADNLENYCRSGCFLGNHCDNTVPGVEVITGSLGHGLGIAAGMALAGKLDGRQHLVFAVIGDGESQEGSIWEAAMFASQHRLSNLIVFLDRNGLGSEDFTENTAGLEPVKDKWLAFGWEVHSVDGHSIDELLAVLADCRSRISDKPIMIIARTVKGKGISFLENTPRSHHTLPVGNEIEIARRDLS